MIFFVLHQTDIHGTRSFNVYGIWIVDLHNVHCPCMYFCTKKIDVSSVVLLLEDLRSTFHGPCSLLGFVLGTVTDLVAGKINDLVLPIFRGIKWAIFISAWPVTGSFHYPLHTPHKYGSTTNHLNKSW